MTSSIHHPSFLIIQTAFIGDVILATALIESLHQKFPDSHIDFVVRKGNEELLLHHPLLRDVLVFDKKEKFKNLKNLIREIRSRHYDYVINVQRFATTGIMTVLSGAVETIGFKKNPLSFMFSRRFPHSMAGLHEVQRNHGLIEFLVGKERSKPRLYPSTDQFAKVLPFKSHPYITVSPGSVWFTKQFSFEKWIEFLSSVPSDLKVYLLGAGNDRALCENIIGGVGNDRVTSLAGTLSMLESAALMKDARMNYVNDSAPMHLASALNAPVTAIYCSTVPEFGFGPLSDQSFVVQTTETLSCRPCGLHGHRQCPQGHFKCSLTIQKEQLLSTLQNQ